MSNNKLEVCIIGAEGYIGSVLYQYLKDCNCTGIDHKNMNGRTLIIEKYTPQFIQSFDVIIYLAGKSSRTSENIDDPIFDIAKLMNEQQLLIYASTSAVYEGHINATEDMIPNYDLLDNYSKSMLARENEIKKLPNIRSVGLRLATVVGLSPRQRSDRIHIQMLKSAIFVGKIKVSNPLGRRCIISMDETLRAVQAIIDNRNRISGHEIYNISSFNTTISSISSSIALLTGAKLTYDNSTNLQGFSVDGDKFKKNFGVEFNSTNESILKDLWVNKQNLLESWSNPIKLSKCIICGNDKMIELIDLGQQPLANQFTQKDVVCPTYPLAMYRCPECHHNQLSHFVSPDELFSDYIYVSGTSKTNDDHFEWFSQQVTKDKITGTVLDIACNDGTQLDKFKSKSWDTYGVDPAENLYKEASDKGHKIILGFWGDEKLDSLLPDSFDVIIAQNVFAHVPDPKLFLLACKNKMNGNSILYIQTSQAELFIYGEYDTLYHEHMSYFTVKSMLYLSKLCGLCLYDVEKVPIHGVSYIFKFRTKRDDDPEIEPNVSKMIEAEQEIYSPYNAIFYRYHVNEKRNLISSMLTKYAIDGYTIIGFGSSAKGNTLLNSLIGITKSFPEYIIDENKLKQNLYTPGTNIPVVSYDKLVDETRPVAILVLAWNFLEEIKDKIRIARESRTTIIMTPFPDTSVLVLMNNEWIKMSEFPLRLSLEKKKKSETLLITHFYNEEFILPYWIMHHASMFDHVVLIDNSSTDNSCQIIKDLAPSHWKIVKSDLELFAAMDTDNQVRRIEKSYPDHVWKLALTVTEFLVWPDMNDDLMNPLSNTYKIHALNIVGDDDVPLEKHIPLIQQRNVYAKYGSGGGDYSRFIHRHSNDIEALYSIGRHVVYVNSNSAINAMLFKYLHTPWPESLSRKLQIADRQEPGDIRFGFGFHHRVNRERLEQIRLTALSNRSNNFYNNSLAGDDGDILRSKLLYKQLQQFWSNKI